MKIKMNEITIVKNPKSIAFVGENAEEICDKAANLAIEACWVDQIKDLTLKKHHANGQHTVQVSSGESRIFIVQYTTLARCMQDVNEFIEEWTGSDQEWKGFTIRTNRHRGAIRLDILAEDRVIHTTYCAERKDAVEQAYKWIDQFSYKGHGIKYNYIDGVYVLMVGKANIANTDLLIAIRSAHKYIDNQEYEIKPSRGKYVLCCGTKEHWSTDIAAIIKRFEIKKVKYKGETLLIEGERVRFWNTPFDLFTLEESLCHVDLAQICSEKGYQATSEITPTGYKVHLHRDLGSAVFNGSTYLEALQSAIKCLTRSIKYELDRVSNNLRLAIIRSNGVVSNKITSVEGMAKFLESHGIKTLTYGGVDLEFQGTRVCIKDFVFQLRTLAKSLEVALKVIDLKAKFPELKINKDDPYWVVTIEGRMCYATDLMDALNTADKNLVWKDGLADYKGFRLSKQGENICIRTRKSKVVWTRKMTDQEAMDFIDEVKS